MARWLSVLLHGIRATNVASPLIILCLCCLMFRRQKQKQMEPGARSQELRARSQQLPSERDGFLLLAHVLACDKVGSAPPHLLQPPSPAKHPAAIAGPTPPYVHHWATDLHGCKPCFILARSSTAVRTSACDRPPVHASLFRTGRCCPQATSQSAQDVARCMPQTTGHRACVPAFLLAPK